MSEDEVDAKTGAPFQTVIGEEAHIYSASPNGPRFDPDYPTEKLETYENRILLCSVHHTRVDARDGAGYDADTLLEMKQRHERQEDRRERIYETLRAYIADQYKADDRVLFRQVKLEGPRVDSMFVDVPLSSPGDTPVAELLRRIAVNRPGDAPADEGFIVVGAAQSLLHPDWVGNALVVGGPGQGKSTLLQYICQFHRARFQGKPDYTGASQGLTPLTSTVRVPIRIDLRDYAQWATSKTAPSKASRRGVTGQTERPLDVEWPQLERYIGYTIARNSGIQSFQREDLATLLATEPVLLALDGLDEIADLGHRDQTGEEIVRAAARLRANAHDLIVIVATRPGMTRSSLWSSDDFPILYLQKLTAGLRLQYLQRWCKVTQLPNAAADKLQATFLEHESLPHIRDLASYPMQLAILLHLLQRRGLLPQQRTDLYREYLQAFLDREQTEDKEPLLSSQREVIVDIHAFLGWHLQKEAEGGQSDGKIAQAELKRLLNQHLAGHEKGQELAQQLFAAMKGRVLCLIEREPGFYQFEVQSLREYFAAAFIDQYADPRGSVRVDCFDALLERPYWLNPCRFFVGMFSKIEVRGIRQSLMAIRSKQGHGQHPHLRLTAGRLLDDRAYLTQPDVTIREIVDFVLDGPGLVLAEDGFLDESGQPLTFAEDAGRSQAISHLEARLLDGGPEGVRRAAALMLRRHARSDDLVRWWWGHFEASGDWLRGAALLGVLEDSVGSHEADLVRAVAAAASATEWVSEVLAQGGYAGNADDVLQVCRAELNDGAADVLTLSAVTPLGQLVDAARTAQSRPISPRSGAGPSARRRLRPNRRSGLVSDMIAGSEQLRNHPGPNTTPEIWGTRLEAVSRLWGDGWVLRQAVAFVPKAVDLEAMARSVANTDPMLERTLRYEREVRQNRANPKWWRSARQKAYSGFEQRVWLFSTLTVAHASVVIELSTEIDSIVANLAPKHFRAMEAALHAFKRSTLGPPLVLQDDLRLGRVSYSSRSLWLLRLVATEGSQDQIDRRLIGAFEDLLVSGMGDRRSLFRALGRGKMIKVASFRGTRELLPAGGWVGNIKLGAMSAAAATSILMHPEDWPVELVGRAIQQATAQLSRLPSIAQIAEENRWFDSVNAD